MGKSKAQIPIETTGAEKAQRDLKQTGTEVENLGRAGARAAGGHQKFTEATAVSSEATKTFEENIHRLADAQDDSVPEDSTAAYLKLRAALLGTGDATDEAKSQFTQFDDKAKTAARSLLTTVNPAIGGLFGLAVDLAEGLKKVNPVLIAIGAGAAVLSGLTIGLRKAFEASQKLKESLDAVRNSRLQALRDQEQSGRGLRQSIAEELVGVGVSADQTQFVLEDIKQLQDAGVTRNFARSAAVARSAGLIGEDDALDFISGIIASGGEVPRFGQGRGRDRSVARRLVARGSQNDARGAALAFINATGEIARAEAPTEDELALPRSATTELLRFQRARGLSDDVISTIQKARSIASPLSLPFEQALRSVDVSGTGLTRETIESLNREALRGVRQRNEEGPLFQPRTGQRPEPGVAIYVTNINEQNVLNDSAADQFLLQGAALQGQAQ